MTEKTRDHWRLRWPRFLRSAVPVMVVLLSVAGSLLAWYLNSAAERAHQDYVRREERYVALVSSLRGFNVAGSLDDKAQFLDQLNLCWLYCSDSVIRAAYRFLGTVQVGATSTEFEREQAAGELVLAIRLDLLSRQPVAETALRADEFKILKPQQPTVNGRGDR